VGTGAAIAEGRPGLSSRKGKSGAPAASERYGSNRLDLGIEAARL
jgi:hypothetical protein